MNKKKPRLNNQSAGPAAQILGVHERTLRRWDENGSIETIRTPAGQRRYNVESYSDAITQ
ncbi:hypothetical protein NIES39_J05070 [Arthrospira platensis NIES-39]|nr:hypothetical protein NIES39_J05070 [Arthrospira platensis NIES-39]